MLQVDGPDWSIDFGLVAGAPAGSQGGPEDTLLGMMMRQLGTISVANLNAALQRPDAPGRRFGDVAQELGFVSESEVKESLERQTDVRIDAFLALRDGRYRFYRGHAV